MLLFAGCDFLDVEQDGILSPDQVDGPEQIDNFVIAAYASLGNDHYDTPLSLWCYGNLRSDDAYKGGRAQDDQQESDFMERATSIRSTFYLPDNMWYLCYVAISRANTALRKLNEVSESDFPLKEQRIGEMRFLRGHFYFILKELFKYVPYIDETVPTEQYETISNRRLSNDELWQCIADDFKAAYDRLPDVQEEVGRPTRFAAAAYLAKTKLYKAYAQDEQNNVIGIHTDDLEEVLTYTNEVMGSSYRLQPDFANNFLPEYQNGCEAIFSVQFSHGDGTMFGRLNFSDVLNAPQGIGGSDFHKPSQNLVNAFRTENGLPLFDSFNDSNYGYENNTYLSDYTRISDPVDPRLYHTVALPGMPFKYDEDYIYQTDWNRNIGTYGIYASLKENVSPASDCFIQMAPFVANSKNRIVLRYADVLLMRAEALIELGRDLGEARSLINQVRERAAASCARLNSHVNNLSVAPYGEDTPLTQEYLRRALRWERRLEFAMEGSRFFDLTRWGVADEVINAYYLKEQTLRTYLKGSVFDRNMEEYLPIPEQQIGYSKGLYVQNYGW